MATIFHAFLVTLLLIVSSLIYFKGIQLIIPKYIITILVVGFVYWQPGFFQMSQSYFAYLFSNKTSSSLAYYLPSVFFVFLIFFIIIIITAHFDRHKYTLIINTQESAKAITEKALKSLKINFISGANESLLVNNNNNSIKFRNDNIDLGEIENELLKISIITAIKKSLSAKGKTDKKRGIFMLATAIIFFLVQLYIFY